MDVQTLIMYLYSLLLGQTRRGQSDAPRNACAPTKNAPQAQSPSRISIIDFAHFPPDPAVTKRSVRMAHGKQKYAGLPDLVRSFPISNATVGLSY